MSASSSSSSRRIYLLDTNIVSELVRAPHGRVTSRIERVGEANVCTSIIVACELRYGAIKRGAKTLLDQLEQVLSVLTIHPLDREADRHYGEIRAELERKGRLIGPDDLLIAAHALALDATLVTDNTREFERVPSLRVENWL